MATTLKSDLAYREPMLFTGFIEASTQNLDAMNQASNGAFVLSTNERGGDIDYNSFFKRMGGGLVSRRDPTSTSAATSKKFEQGTFNSIKLNRKIGPAEYTLDALRKGGIDEDALRFAAGQAAGQDVVEDQVNTVIRIAAAALDRSETKHVIATNGTMTTAGLASGLAKFGDASARVVAWVMHGKVFHDLVQEQIGQKLVGMSNLVVYGGTPASFGRPVIVTDSPALVKITGTGSAQTTDYMTLGLVNGAVAAENTEIGGLVFEGPITGGENLFVRMQGEYAYNVGARGFTWDAANGGSNPTDTALGTQTNWDAAYASFKDWAGIAVQSR